MTPRLVLAAALCLLLSSCWVGPVYYAEAETRRPIPSGDYLSTALDETGKAEAPQRLSISAAGGGLTVFAPQERGEAPSIAGFASLDGSDLWFVGWLLVEGAKLRPGEDVVYFLLERSDAAFRVILPNCDEDRPIAAAAGARIEPDKKATLCRFSDRASLEQAMRALREKGRAALLIRPAGR